MVALYRELPFVLIGDSGQRDPEIYAQVVREHPGRVLAIYIRNVSRDPARQRAIEDLAVEVVEAGSTLLLASDSMAMARHAAEHGLIAPALWRMWPARRSCRTSRRPVRRARSRPDHARDRGGGAARRPCRRPGAGRRGAGQCRGRGPRSPTRPRQGLTGDIGSPAVTCRSAARPRPEISMPGTVNSALSRVSKRAPSASASARYRAS